MHKILNILFQNMSMPMNTLSYILLLPYVLTLYQVTNVSKNMYPSNQIIDFGYHWVAFTYNNGYINFTDWQGVTAIGQVTSGAIAMNAKVDILNNIRRILIVTYPDNNLYFYQNNTISLKDPSFPSIQNAIFISENYVIGMTTSQQLVKINYLTMVRQKIYTGGFKYNDSYLLAGIQTKIGVLSEGLLNTTLTVLNQNLIIMNFIQLSEDGGERELRYDIGSDLFVRCAKNIVEVYDSSLTLIKQFPTPTLKKTCGLPINIHYQFYSAVICNNVILINIFDRIVIYQIKNWTYVVCLTLSTFSITNYTRLNCYPQYLMFSVAFLDANNNQIIQQFSINDIYVNPPLNNNFSTSNLNSTLNNTATPNKIVEIISQFINSSETKNIAKSTFSVIGFCATSPLTQNFVKPFLSLLTDLWFYGYHSTKYTDFIQLFTNQVDIWNELRIKPDIFNGVVIPKNQKENQLYSSTSHLQIRARKTVFMLLSIQDIYLFNISICLAQWIVNIILKYLFGSLSQKCNILERIYKKMLINSLWWSFLMALMQPNIAQVTFYGFIQMKDFYCFNFFSKINITISALLVFIVLFYSFSFFPILKRLDEQDTTRYAFEISKRRSRASGVILETFLRGFRSFSQALIHVILINDNQSQLMGLVILDLLFIGLLLRYRLYFKRKIIFFFSLLYYLSLLSFDLMLVLFVYSQTMKLDQASEEMQKYELASMIIILIITGTIFLKTLSEILKSLFDCVKFMVKKLRERSLSSIKIYDPNSILNRVTNQKSLKKLGKKRKQQKRTNQFNRNNYIKSKKTIQTRQQQTNSNNMVKIHIIRNGKIVN